MLGTQLQAGYLVESIKEILLKYFPEQEELIESLYHNLSYFEIESNIDFSLITPDINPIFAVLNNIVTRGLPTRLNLDLEQKILEITNKFEKVVEYGTIKFKSNEIDNDIIQLLFRSLHIIDPRINRDNALKEYNKSWERLGSEYEEDFLYKKLPESFNQNGDFVIQLFETQRSLSELLKLNNIPPAFEQNFTNQRVDFSVEFPVPFDEDSARGVIVEVDGSQHNETAQHKLDIERDNKAKECNWSTIRIKTSEWNNVKHKLSPLGKYLESDYYKVIKDNHINPIWDKELGKEALQLILTPYAIARIQKTLVEFLLHDALKISEPEWKIAVIEKDVPCAALAFEDLFNVLKNLYKLQGLELKLPEIKLQIYSNDELCFCKLNEQNLESIKLLNETVNDETEYDLVIDISILERRGLSQRVKFSKPPKNYAVIRSIHSIQSTRKISSATRIKYQPICIRLANDNFEDIESSKLVLTEFLRNIFRKEEFRLGQLPILNRALQLESVIGLLQTGGGKSLTYQLAALLQPGITIIVDPIKSLMKDQVDGLKRNHIDNCLYVNSTLNYGQRKVAQNRVLNGEAIFLFISPERLQIDEFRKVLKSLFEKKLYFSYCVIDEAHCVSEWGHDFRTSYLKLGENAIKYCQTSDLAPISLFGLTATASFDVLSDILREISTKDQLLDSDAIIRYETTNRPEIQYEIIEAFVNPIGRSEYAIREQLGEEKQRILNELINDISNRIGYYNITEEEIFNSAYVEDPQRIRLFGEFNSDSALNRMKITEDILNDFYNDECSNAGLIFCPHRSWVFGVTDKFNNNNNNLKGVYDNIRNDLNIKAGTFIGTNNEDDKNNIQIEKENVDNQDNFIKGKLNLLVCTKAFGMGIDKPNIRFSIHINYPSSIESFIQESGRIGRDGRLSLAFIFFNQQEFHLNNQSFEVDTKILEDFYLNSFRGVEKEKRIIWELLTEISYPPSSNLSLIDNYLDENGYEAYCTLWCSDRGYYYLFIQKSFEEKYGCLPLNNHNPDVSRSNLDQDISLEILNSVKNFIENNITPNSSWLNWMQREVALPNQPGINIVLTENEDFLITFNFNNNWNEIYQIIRSFLQSIGLTKNFDQIKRAHLFNPNGTKGRAIQFDIFYDRLGLNLNDAHKTRLNKIFNRIRDKQDTEKALYRLSILGIIDEYDVDYRCSTYTIIGRKKTDSEIKEAIKNYLSKYYSENRINIELTKIDLLNQNGYLYKTIRYLIDFIYSEIGKKRKQAIYDMKYACQYRVETSNIEFKDYIYYYFNSKYARKGYEEDEINKSLYDRVLTDGRDDFDLVWEFINYMESQVNNFRHLRGACIRLLQLRPEFFSLHLLKAYAVLSIEQRNLILLEDAIQSIIKGFEFYFQNLEPEGKLYFDYVDKFIDMIREHTMGIFDSRIDDAINLLKFKYHRMWLEKFNKSFLVDYERTNT